MVYGILFVWYILGMPYKVIELLALWQGKFGRHRFLEVCAILSVLVFMVGMEC